MTKISRYLIAALLISVSCVCLLLSVDAAALQVIGIMMLCSSAFILDPGEFAKQIKIKLRWNAIGFYTTLISILGIALVIIIFYELPDRGTALMSKWYFVGTLWLICLAGLAKRYTEEIEKDRLSAQHGNIIDNGNNAIDTRHN